MSQPVSPAGPAVSCTCVLMTLHGVEGTFGHTPSLAGVTASRSFANEERRDC
jgi:hypothetical protein